MTNQGLTIEQDLCNRYGERLKTVFSNPSPYYKNALWERTEILNKIKELEKINTLK